MHGSDRAPWPDPDLQRIGRLGLGALGLVKKFSSELVKELSIWPYRLDAPISMSGSGP